MPGRHKVSGFTIVELLIVIVVIAILAAISIVAYNGIQARAENTKTLVAAESYYKAIKMYEVDNGRVPQTFVSCLGEDYKWDFDGNDSGANQCKSTSTGTSYYYIRGSINTDLKEYITPPPDPSKQTVGSSSKWIRGITYAADGGIGSDLVLFFGLKDTDSCPAIAGKSAKGTVALSNGVQCEYIIGIRLQ